MNQTAPSMKLLLTFKVGEFEFQVHEVPALGQFWVEAITDDGEETLLVLETQRGYAGYVVYAQGGRVGNLYHEGGQWVYYRRPISTRHGFGIGGDLTDAIVRIAKLEIEKYGKE